MRPFSVTGVSSVKGKVALLGDKSIAHRSIIVSALALGRTTIENFPANKDCLYTQEAFKRLGVKIIRKAPGIIIVEGKGLNGLTRPKGPIFTGESGTTFRLLLGVLAGQGFKTKVTAAKSLSRRPMLRVTSPLRMMGAEIITRRRPNTQPEEYPPITIRGGNLKAITYKVPVASAQVKSAILLAGLYARGMTEVIEPLPTRDHTERMLKLFGADIRFKLSSRKQPKNNKIIISSRRRLVSPGKIYVPGDVSSAAFFMVLAAILPKAHILIKKVSLNPLRAGVVRALKRMGAHVIVNNSCLAGRQVQLTVHSYEPIGDLIVKSSRLKGAVVKKEEIPSLIDELPILMVAACYARGKTIFEGVGELRVKETDRIRSMSWNLIRMGADIKVVNNRGREDIVVCGRGKLKGAPVKTFGDHRTAMSLVIAGLNAEGKTSIDDVSCISKSFPEFLSVLKGILA